MDQYIRLRGLDHDPIHLLFAVGKQSWGLATQKLPRTPTIVCQQTPRVFNFSHQKCNYATRSHDVYQQVTGGNRKNEAGPAFKALNYTMIYSIHGAIHPLSQI